RGGEEECRRGGDVSEECRHISQSGRRGRCKC
ncbi:short-chain dehydrogenase, partial [Escherichia coli]